MKKSEIEIKPKFFDRYIDQVKEDNLMQSLENSLVILQSPEIQALQSIENKAYAEKKWTVKQIFQHLIDTERIFAYRALRFARNDKSNLHGFDEESYAENADVSNKTFKDLLDELITVRKATIYLFKSFDKATLLRSGVANDVEISVLALGFTAVGHQNHHFKVIKERYL
jgi:hypothetical protein